MMSNKRRRFLFISNIVISVLAAAAIATCFVLPIWQVEFQAEFTDQIGDAVKNTLRVDEDHGAMIVLTSDESTGATEISDLLPDAFSKRGKEILKSFVDELCKSDLKISFTQSFYSSDMIAALYDQDSKRAADVIDKSVDQFIDDAEKIISDFLQTAAKAAAKEFVRTAVDSILKSDYEYDGYDQLTDDLGSEKDRIDALVDRIIDAVMKDGATVSSVTDIVLESADEAQKILSAIPKFSEDAELYDDEARANVKKSTEELLDNFADENGEINFKDSLLRILLNAANQAIENYQSANNAFSVSGMSLTTNIENKPTVEESEEELKTHIKKTILNAGNGVIANTVVGLMAISGAFILILIFMLFYPILRTLTNIGAENPGFSMFLPVFGGICSYSMLVLIPSALPQLLRLIAAKGESLSIPTAVTSVINAVSIKFCSGTIAAFILAVILFIFGFFYMHQRRELDKDIRAEELRIEFVD